MRICFVSRRYWPAVSGMSAYAENLLRHLVRAGHEVTMVSQYRGDAAGRAVYGGGPPPPELVPAGVRVLALEALGEQAVGDGRPADFEADVAALCAAVVELHGERPFDLVHAQYAYPTGLAALRAAAAVGVAAVVSVQGGDGHWVGTCCATHRELVRGVFAGASALLIGSASFAAEVSQRHGVPGQRWTVVPGATDAERFTPARPPGSVQDPPVLLYHGRVDARKGVLDLLDAVRLLRDRSVPVRLLLSGVGPDSAAVAARVLELGLDGAVEQLGHTGYHEAAEVYRRGDVFVSPTYAEGFSNTILEAMATGLPVVSTDVVGVRDCVRDGRNGLLVAPRDPTALAGAVQRLLDDAALRERLASAALDEVRARWSWPVVAGLITDEYDRVLGGPPPPAVPDAAVDAGCRFRAAPHLL